MINLKKELPDLQTAGLLSDIAAADPFVTTASRWSHDQWVMDGRTPGRAAFKVFWHPGETPQPLLDELKYLAACLLIQKYQGRPRLKYSNADAFSVAVRYFARFMEAHSYASLVELDANAFASFQRYLQKTASRVSDVFDEAVLCTGNEDDDPLGPVSTGGAANANDVEIDRPTFSFVELRLRFWSWINWVSPQLTAAGIPIQLGDVFRKTTLPQLAGSISARGLNDVEDLPDEVLVPVLTEAYRLIGEPANQVIELQARYLEIGPKHSSDDKEVSLAREALLQSAAFMIPRENEPWFNLQQDGGKNASLTMHTLVRLIRDACMVVLAAGIGWRISEASSVELEDRDDDEALPSCIFATPSYTGTSEHFWVRGKLSKHRPEPTPEDWLIGARLAGTTAEPMTVRAFRVLEKLYRPWRRLASSPNLRKHLLVDWVGAGVTFEPANVRFQQAEQLRMSSQEFIKKRAGLQERLAPLVANNPKLEPYWRTGGACIRPHQWRRTFFRLMYRMDSNLLPAISRHFKHVSLAVTENGYAPSSPAALEEREAVATSELVAVLFERGEGGERPISGGDVMLERHREVLASIIDDDSLEDAAPRLADWAAEHDLRLWPAEHGSCLINLNPDKAMCHSFSGRIDWRVERPNLSKRNPALCCSCPNFIVTKRDAPFWERRYRENRQAWMQSGKNPTFRFARDRARQARTILEHLNAVPTDLANEEN